MRYSKAEDSLKQNHSVHNHSVHQGFKESGLNSSFLYYESSGLSFIKRTQT